MSKNTNEIVEAEIIKDNDGKKARKKVENKRRFNEVILPLLIDVALLVLGVCLLIWADRVTSAISISIGIIFTIYGLYNFIDYGRTPKELQKFTTIITGIALIIAGVFLIVQTNFIKDAISFIVGTFIIIISLIRLQDAAKLRALGATSLLSIVLPIIGLVAGVFCIIGKIMITDIFIQILGAMLIIFAISNIANNIALNKLKKSK